LTDTTGTNRTFKNRQSK